MKKIIYFIIISLFFLGCVWDRGPYCGGWLFNLSQKNLYIIFSKEPFLKEKDSYHKSFIIKKIINNDTIWNEKVVTELGDSIDICVSPLRNDFESSMKENYKHDSIYIFLLDTGVLRHQSWDSIVEKQMYENVLVYSIDSLKKMNWRVEYKGKYVITNPPPVGN